MTVIKCLFEMKLPKLIILSLSSLILLTFSIEGISQRTFQVIDTYKIISHSESHKILIPLTGLKTQTILDMQFSTIPDEVIEENGDFYALWAAGVLKKKEKLTITSTIRLHRKDLYTANQEASANIQAINLSEYLVLEEDYRPHLTEIKSLAKELKKDSVEATLKNIFNFVVSSLKPSLFAGKTRGIHRAITKKKGISMEYSELMIALCRVNQIPTRMISGSYLLPEGELILHDWVEAYIPNKGWIMFDPYLADNLPRQIEFSQVPNRYIAYSFNRFTNKTEETEVYNKDWIYLKFKSNWIDEMTPLFEKMYSHYQKRAHNKALAVLKEMTKLDPLYYRIYEFKGLIEARKGNFVPALKNLEYAKKLAYTLQEKGSITYSFANYYALKGEKQRAISLLQNIIEQCLCKKKVLANDEDLISLRDMPAFQALFTK